MSTVGEPDERPDPDDIDARFEQLVAPLRRDLPRAPRAPRGSATHPAGRGTPHARPSEPFSLDDALERAEPDDEPLELPVLPAPRVRAVPAAGFALLGTAIVLAFLALMGVRLGHLLGSLAAAAGVVGLVLLLLSVRRGPRDDSLDHDPRDGSRL